MLIDIKNGEPKRKSSCEIELNNFTFRISHIYSQWNMKVHQKS